MAIRGPDLIMQDLLYYLYHSLFPVNAKPGLLWYEDNNLGVNGGVPLDMYTKFDEIAWQFVPIDVYLLHMVVLSNCPATWLTGTLLPFLARGDIALALDAEGATWTQWGGREAIFTREMKLLERLSLLGIPVRYISLQSALSKRTPDKSEYPLGKRIYDIKRYIETAWHFHPEACVGLIDAAPTLGMNWRKMYTELLSKVGDLSYLHLDAPYHHIRGWFDLSWREINQVAEFVKAQRMDFGLLVTAANQSNAGFVKDVTKMHNEARKMLGYQDTILTSWFPCPDNTVPLITDLLNHLKQEKP